MYLNSAPAVAVLIHWPMLLPLYGVVPAGLAVAAVTDVNVQPPAPVQPVVLPFSKLGVPLAVRVVIKLFWLAPVVSAARTLPPPLFWIWKPVVEIVPVFTKVPADEPLVVKLILPVPPEVMPTAVLAVLLPMLIVLALLVPKETVAPLAACRLRLPELVVKLELPAPTISTPLLRTSKNLVVPPLFWTDSKTLATSGVELSLIIMPPAPGLVSSTIWGWLVLRSYTCCRVNEAPVPQGIKLNTPPLVPSIN